MLNWQQTEFLLKGVYLGLLVMIAFLAPTWDDLAIIGLFTLAGLALFLGSAAIRKIREGYHVRGRWLGFLIFLLLESPWMVYAGILLGLSCGTWWTFKWWDEREITPQGMIPVAAGAVLGG